MTRLLRVPKPYLSRMPPKPCNVPAFKIPVLSPAPITGRGWIHELKYDGYRTLLRLDRGQAQAFSRGGHDWTDKYSHVIESCRKLRCRSALIDGEVIVQDQKGVSDFAALRAAIEWEPHRLVMFAFDLLYVEGADVRRLPLVERRQKLRHLIPEDARFPIQFNDHYEGEGLECSSGPAPPAWKALSPSGRSAPTKAVSRSSGSRQRTSSRAN